MSSKRQPGAFQRALARLTGLDSYIKHLETQARAKAHKPFTITFSITGDTNTYTVEIHTDPDGRQWALILELPGCFASGENIAELFNCTVESIRAYRKAT